MRKYLFALLLIAQSAFSATPTISSASLSGSTLTISGSNFDTKTTAAPHFFEPMTSVSDGVSQSSLGFYDNNNNETKGAFAIVSGDGVGVGAKSLFKTIAGSGLADNGGWFPHLGVTLPANTTQAYASFDIKIRPTLGTNPDITKGSLQLKGPRAGVYFGAGSDNQDNYNAQPHLASTLFIKPNGAWSSGGDSNGNTSYAYAEQPPSPDIDGDIGSGHVGTAALYPDNWSTWDGWNHWEVYFKFNTAGSSDGEITYWVNGKQIQSYTAVNARSSSSQYLQYMTIWPGFAFMHGIDWDFFVSRVYIDTTQARVRLGNASTLSACTNLFIVPSSSWASGSITANTAAKPSGYDWVYVTNSTGETNVSGFAYSAGGDATASPASVTLTAAANDPTYAVSSSITPSNVVSILSVSNASASNGSSSAQQKLRRRGFRNGFGF